MSTRHSGHPTVDDELVIAIVIRHLQGESVRSLSEDTKIHRNTIKKWCTGENRSQCYWKAYNHFYKK